MCDASGYVLRALNARLWNERGGDFVRRQSTLSETLARVATPNFAFIIFAFFFPTSFRPEWVLARQTKSRESEQLLEKNRPIVPSQMSSKMYNMS